MSCTTCTPVKKIPTCVDQLFVGSIEDENKEVYVYVRNITTGYTHRYEAESDNAGQIEIDLTEPGQMFYNENHFYELWVTSRDGQVEDRIEISPIDSYGSDSYECFNLEFTKISVSDGLAPYTSHTLELDA